MYRHIDDVIAGSVRATNQMIQIKSEKRKLPQMERIEELPPTGGVGHIAVIGNEGVIKMEWVVERRPKEQDSRQNQSSRDFHAIFAGPIIQNCASMDGLNASHGRQT